MAIEVVQQEEAIADYGFALGTHAAHIRRQE